jgi:NAD(P)H-hydrate epimerase
MISVEEMRKLEDTCRIPKIRLMEYAGKGVYETLRKRFVLKNKKILVVAYHGNNGGDGFVAARYLCDECEVDVLFLGDEAKFKEEALANYKKIENNEKIQFLTFDNVDFNYYDIIIDAILGVGVRGKLREDISNAIDRINNSKAYKVAVDIPTGMNPDTGEVIDKCVDADLIVTFHDIKQGLEKLKYKTVVVDIGINERVVKD